MLAVVTVQRSGAADLFLENQRCCQLSIRRNLRVTLDEMSGRTAYPSEIGQDKWVLEKVFPGVTNGFFVDVGSGHGTIGSNTLALERRGWTGICVDPFPVHMEGRTCRVYQEVVFSEGGRVMDFRTAGGLGGIDDTLGAWNVKAARAPVVQFKTVTLDDLLARAKAPSFIHFVSLDIEGAELEALRGFPFDRYRVGAWTIEHNREEPKRSQIQALLASHGYERVHSWQQDDYYVFADASD
jgi:FkbM family methyltransferase